MHETLVNNYFRETGHESELGAGQAPTPSSPAGTYCSYFQALVLKQKTWFFVATLRSFEHLCFDRTWDKEMGRFEFFVPAPRKDEFVALMHWYESQGIISDFQELPNRLAQ